MAIVPLNTNAYRGKVIDASWDTVLGLRDVGAEFFLLLRKDDRIGKLLHNAVANFIAHRHVLIYVVQVFVDRDVAAADHLAAVMVPQLRYYRDGVEHSRHRGVADYDTISQLMVID